MSRIERSNRIVGLAILALAAGAGASFAAPSYRVDLNYNTAIQGTPFSRDGNFEVSSSNSTSWYTGHGASDNGVNTASCHIDTEWSNGLSGGGGGETYAGTSTDDFVISGPGGSVTGTLRLLVSAALRLEGGFPPAGGQSHVWANLNVNGIGTYGDFTLDSNGPHGTGLFAAASGTSIRVPVSLTGSFPVNSPFGVSFSLQADAGTYGNVSYNPGLAEATVTALLDESFGPVMDLPNGYTLNSASWSIANSIWSPPAGVGGPRAAAELSLSMAGANPAAGPTQLACVLPAAGPIDVAIFDLSGRRVRTLAKGWHEAGNLMLAWDGRTNAGSPAGCGVFFARAEAGGRGAVQRIVRLR
ncbi:MAG TPA: FlgD immunoglobulin-like domain containing protein [Candidatus Eisenbacteria bacterium]|nr:FlgD immunoglobulin-like domain containing protein [Candidatus Eisenbacteria bacterium]